MKSKLLYVHNYESLFKSMDIYHETIQNVSVCGPLSPVKCGGKHTNG